MTLSEWYRLSKPGIVYGNTLHGLAGICIAAASVGWNWRAAIGVLLGMALVIASACIVNNYRDRGIDARMKRTRIRPSVTKTLTLRQTALSAGAMGLLGGAILYLTTNIETLLLGLAAYVFYAWLYTTAKRRTPHSTIIGAVPGALPPVAGYVALTGMFDTTAVLLFVLVGLWQLPHFYAISLFRKKEYKAASVPIASVVWGESVVAQLIRASIMLYWAVAVWLSVQIFVLPAAILFLVGVSYWLYVTLRPYTDVVVWSRHVFKVSLIITILFVIASAVHLATSYIAEIY